MKGTFSVTTSSAEETRIVGASLAAVVLPGDVVSLSGDLGSGKTVFVQGLAAAIGVFERVTSPTFTIHQQYRGRFNLSHVDVYRLDSFQEVLDLGLEELLETSVLVVEWGDAVSPLLPRRRLEVTLRIEGEDKREITFRPGSAEWASKLAAVEKTVMALLAAASPAGTEPEVGSPPAPPTREASEAATEPREEDEER